MVGAAFLIGVWSGSATAQSSSTPPRRSHILHRNLSAFTVVGIPARTSNSREAGPDGVIPRQWQAFFRDGVADRIPNKVGRELYAVYSEYASDHNGEYTFIIGCKVKDGTAAPAGMIAQNIPEGEYAIMTSDQGPLASVVPAAWRKVYEFEAQGELHRAYQADFELYDQRAHDPQNAQVDLYLGVR